jgi:hypothetical protein
MSLLHERRLSRRRRRRDVLLGYDGLDPLQVRERRVPLGNGLIEGGLRDGALLDEILLPLVIEVRLRERRLVIGKLGLLHGGIELHELRTFLDVVAAIEEIVGHEARHLGGDIHPFHRDERGDGVHPFGPVLDPGNLRGDRRRRRHHLRHELADHLRLEDEVEVGQSTEEQADDAGGDDKALDHDAISCWPPAKAYGSNPSHLRRPNCAP